MTKKFTRLAAAALYLWAVLTVVSAAELLVPGGQAIGMKLKNGAVTVADFDAKLGDHAKAAGLRPGDRILTVDGSPIDEPEDVARALQKSSGTVRLTLLRDGQLHNLEMAPKITKNGPRLGVFLRAGVSGIGTLTWYDPDSGTFGALGHGVSTPEGQLVEMEEGSVYDANIRGAQKGRAGTPGQLLGSIQNTKPVGTLSGNTVQGIFGKSARGWKGEPLPMGSAQEIRKGPAQIRSTLPGQGTREYSVEILKLYPGSDTRNLLLQVTDPALLEATGGIVQGMSGSPIIQDGKLVGAVTHVLVNDPTRGYGIFIENMLDAAG